LPTQDPHFVDAKPSLALTLAKADLLLSVGLDLEIGWLPTLLTGSKNGKIQPGARGYLECSQFVKVLEVPTGTVNRSQGDVHPKGNPHYMYDPRQAARVVKGISDKLGKLDPAHSADYKKNALALIRKLGQSTKAWEKALTAAKGKKVVGYHKSFVYLASWLGLSIVEDVEPRPGIPPNPHHVTHVIETMKKEGVKALLQESYYPTKTSQLIAKETGATVIQISGGPASAVASPTSATWTQSSSSSRRSIRSDRSRPHVRRAPRRLSRSGAPPPHRHQHRCRGVLGRRGT
jgi:zinc/manganese transport system substrate-binding protein